MFQISGFDSGHLHNSHFIYYSTPAVVLFVAKRYLAYLRKGKKSGSDNAQMLLQDLHLNILNAIDIACMHFACILKQWATNSYCIDC